MAELDSAMSFLVSDENGNKENEEDIVDHLIDEQKPEGVEDYSEEDDVPLIDIYINNVVCTFSTRCHLDLSRIAREGKHVEYKRQNGVRTCIIQNI